MRTGSWLLLISLASSALAAPERKVPVAFARQQATRWGESVYLLGDLPELGGGDPRRALRMLPDGAGGWALTVALPPERAFRHQFLLRQDAAGALADPRNAFALGPVEEATTPGAAPRLVRVRYLTGWSRPRLVHHRPDGSWAAVDLRPAGPGRGAGEQAFTGELLTTSPLLELRFEDGSGGQDLAPGGGPYRTGYGAFTVVDGSVHPEAAGPLPTPGKGRVFRIPAFRSAVLGNARPVHVWLPRGYDGGARRYPVLYVHDGQNLFQGEGPFGGWGLDETLDRLVDQGRLSELIVVGVGNTPARMSEYIPEEDGGQASRYARFLIEELKPWVDARLRTLADPAHTGVLGSSLGGLVSLHLAWERPEVFGRAGSLSGSFWLDGWLSRKTPGAPQGRVWIDSGSGGSSGDGALGTLALRDALLRQGWTLGANLGHLLDPGAPHQEPAWRARVGQALEFLFPAE